jgi:hypothetical protein
LAPLARAGSIATARQRARDILGGVTVVSLAAFVESLTRGLDDPLSEPRCCVLQPLRTDLTRFERL